MRIYNRDLKAKIINILNIYSANFEYQKSKIGNHIIEKIGFDDNEELSSALWAEFNTSLNHGFTHKIEFTSIKCIDVWCSDNDNIPCIVCCKPVDPCVYDDTYVFPTFIWNMINSCIYCEDFNSDEKEICDYIREYVKNVIISVLTNINANILDAINFYQTKTENTCEQEDNKNILSEAEPNVSPEGQQSSMDIEMRIDRDEAWHNRNTV